MESNAKWAQLLNEVVTKPGLLHECFGMLHNYSVGNVMMAATQMRQRGMVLGPIATFDQWKRQGRHVRKGQQAIALWMPMTINVKEEDENGNKVPTGEKKVIFTLKNNWFCLGQTDGQAVAIPTLPDYDLELALSELNIKREQFDISKVGSNNCQGYAYKRIIAVSELCPKPLATTMHEIAHVVLGHTEKGIVDEGAALPRCIKELEAESTAMIVLDALGHGEMTVYNRGYIQHWMEAGKVKAIPEDSAKRIFSAADKILKAGQVKESKAQAA